MQLYVEWMRYQQRKSEEAATLTTTTATLTTLSTNARNDLVLQKSGEGPSSPFKIPAFASTKIELLSVNQLPGKLCCLICNRIISFVVPKFSYEP